MAKRIYEVVITDTDIGRLPRLIRATSQAAANRHVWDSLTFAELASQERCVALGKAGVEIEDAGGE